MYRVVIKPSKAAQVHFNYICFSTLSGIFTTILNSLHKRSSSKTVTLIVKSTSKLHSKYNWKTNIITISEHAKHLKDNVRGFISRFTHEFRHWFQSTFMKINFWRNYEPDGMAYFRCPVEEDARKFDRDIIRSIITTYKGHNRLKEAVKESKKTKVVFN